MKIRTFKYGFKSGWEINFISEGLNLRIARFQLALWYNLEPIFNFTT